MSLVLHVSASQCVSWSWRTALARVSARIHLAICQNVYRGQSSVIILFFDWEACSIPVVEDILESGALLHFLREGDGMHVMLEPWILQDAYAASLIWRSFQSFA
jgi:hypothetical protein